jgi:N-acetyltransferase
MIDISVKRHAVMRLEPITLQGRHIRLEPLDWHHLADLEKAGADANIWRWLPSAHNKPGTMEAFIEQALSQQANGAALPFATVDQASGHAIGSTRYHYIEMAHRRLEIGVTWLAIGFQRTAANTEAKYLMLEYAFSVLGCRRVEFKADAENARSRAAILRLGAQEEGLFRNHMIYPDGRTRHSVYFSIIVEEWPGVCQNLQKRLVQRT